MKYTLLLSACALMLLSACKETDRETSKTDTSVNEPAGAQYTNAPPVTTPRDFNERAYPGMDPTERKTGY